MRLTGLRPVASGERQLVFEHPGDRALIIKVMKNASKRSGGPLWSRLLARYYFTISFKRVLREYERVRSQTGTDPAFLQKSIGLIRTDFGLGLVAAVERGPDGEIAPTLRTLAKSGRFDARAKGALSRFCSELEAVDIVVSDLNPRNLVYSMGPAGEFRFVLIDGTGDKTMIPLRRFSKLLRHVSKKYKLARLRRRTAGSEPTHSTQAATPSRVQEVRAAAAAQGSAAQ